MVSKKKNSLTKATRWSSDNRSSSRSRGRAPNPYPNYDQVNDPMRSVVFVVVGDPVGKERARSGSNSARHLTPKKTREYEHHVAWSAVDVLERTMPCDRELWPTECQVYLDLNIYHRNGRKPDSDNVVKAIADGLSGILWKDDRHVLPRVWLETWPDKCPRVEVSIKFTGYVSHDGALRKIEQVYGPWKP